MAGGATSAACILVLLALASAAGAATPAPAPAVDCTAAFAGLADCLDYVSPGSKSGRPSKTCCGEVKTAVNSPSTVDCLCAAMAAKTSPLPVNMTRVLALPTACGESPTVFTKCKVGSILRCGKSRTRDDGRLVDTGSSTSGFIRKQHVIFVLCPIWLRLLKIRRLQVLRSSLRMLVEKQGGGPSGGSRFVDFPTALGLRPIQGCRGGAATARQRHVFFDAVVFVVFQDLFVFFLFLEGCSVRWLD